ncbi:MAG: P44/Msp2 family outer membrane protein [Anaplasma sp.]
MSFLRCLAVSFVGLSLVCSSSVGASVLDRVVDSLRGLYVDATYKPASPFFSDLEVRGPFGTTVRALPLSEVKSGTRVLHCGNSGSGRPGGSDSRASNNCAGCAASGASTCSSGGGDGSQQCGCLCLAGVGAVRGSDFECGSRVLAGAGDYRRNLSGFGLTLGYPVGDVRVELEVSKQKFDVERGSHELARYKKEEGADHGYSVVHMKLAGDPDKPLARTSNSAAARLEDEAAVVVKDGGIRLCSVIVNLCRDFKLSDSMGDNMLPYACGGFGFEKLGMFGTNTRRITYQAKAGVTYKLRDGIDGFAGVFYRKLHGSKEVILPWSNFEVISTVPAGTGAARGSDGVMPVDLLLDLNVAYFGAEVGVRFSL